MARKRTGIADFHTIWQRHEALYKDVFCQALEKIAGKAIDFRFENAISEVLCLELREVCYNHPDQPALPQWESPIKPIYKSNLTGGNKAKRPDFTCSLVNTYASSKDEHEISLHVECKRLGVVTEKNRLSVYYVEEGIARFDTVTHAYGKMAPSGMMIGYVMGKCVESVWAEVNKAIIANGMNVVLYDRYVELRVDVTESCYHRCVVTPFSFKLIHMWVQV